jgi:LDH2 family malate/lactate/ureidoglycolate dehydrogenase
VPDADDVRIDPAKLRRLGIRVLEAAGVPRDHAEMTVEVLLKSDLRGIESHGFARFVDFYVNRAREGRVNLHPDVRVIEETLAAATIDGDHALGFVPSTIAMRLAIDKARVAGVGMVTVLNSTHYGPASPYALMAMDEGMIGISMTTGGKYVAPPGGAARTYGLNAFSFAAPCRPPEPALCLDMAASVVAAGKFEIARRREKPVPVGWGIEQDGTPITDANRLYEVMGAILPLGGDPEHGAWKGFGLSLMVDVLTSVLSGGPDSSQQPPTRNANHFFGALRIDAFTPLDAYYDRMQSMKDSMRAAPRLEGAGPLTFPGEPEAAMEEECLEKGIPYHPSIPKAIRKVCKELGVEYDL